MQFYLIFSILSLSFLLPLSSFAQNDTVYFGANWDTITKDSAAYFRLPMEYNGTNYSVKDYYITGELQFTGASSSNTEELLDGFCTWFYKNGKTQQTSYMVNGQINGETVWFDPDGTEVARGIYSYDSQVSGTFLSEEAFYRQITTIDSVNNVKTKIFDLYGGTKAAYEYYLQDSIYVYNIYDNSGKLLCVTKVDSNTMIIKDGLEVLFNYNPFSISSIATIKDGKYVDYRKNFYTNGNLKSIEYFDNSSYSEYNNNLAKVIYYKKDGSVWDSIVYKNTEPFDGTSYEFNSEISLQKYYSDNIKTEKHYKSGNPDGIWKTNWENGKTQKIEQYVNNKKEGLWIYYDSVSGAEIYKMKYVNDKEFEGTVLLYNTVYEYKNYELVSQKELFDNGKVKTIMSKINGTDSKTIFYNSDGSLLGEIITKDGNPYNGDFVEYSYYDEIENITSYKNGTLTETKYFVDNKLSFSSINDGTQSFYDSITQTTYKCVIKDGQPIDGDFVSYESYSNSVEGITTYKNGKKNGKSVRYTFDYESSERILESEEYYEDDMLNGISKTFKRGLLSSSTHYENDYPVGATYFYNENEEIIDSLVYQDGMIFSGKQISFDDSGFITSITDYENAQIILEVSFSPGTNDTLTKTVYTDSKNFQKYSYYSNSQLREMYSVKDQNIEGTVISYLPNGNTLAKGTYSENIPSSGTFAFFDYYNNTNSYVIIEIGKKAIEISYKSEEEQEDQFSFSRKKGFDKKTIEELLVMLNSKYTSIEFTKNSSNYWGY